MGAEYDYVVVDIETTGLRPDSDQICEIAAIGIADGLPRASFQTLVAIEGAMPESAFHVNGITDDMLKGAPSIEGALIEFEDFAGRDAVLVGHNIEAFDLPFLETAAARCRCLFSYVRVIDTLLWSREVWPNLPGHSMDFLRGVLGISRVDAHRAHADCMDCIAVLNALLAADRWRIGVQADEIRDDLRCLSESHESAVREISLMAEVGEGLGRMLERAHGALDGKGLVIR